MSSPNNNIEVKPDRLSDAWSATDFEVEEIKDFAHDLIALEARRGLTTMALLFFAINSAVALFCTLMATDMTHQIAFISTHVLLALLSLHIAISSRWMFDYKVLNLLGMALLVVTGAALMLLAHRVGNLNVALMIGFALLFMAMPIMSWGLKESLIVVTLIYFLLTLSSHSVSGRFDQSTLWTLQFLVIASALTALVLTARNVGIRKHDIRSRFELEKACEHMEKLSNIDPLTASWNRRFLDENYDAIARECADSGQSLELAILDVDSFKHFNDTFGHHVGDQILCILTATMKKHLPEHADFIRLGGDEFAVLCGGDNLRDFVAKGLDSFNQDSQLRSAVNGESVTVSQGFSKSPSHRSENLKSLYQKADVELYEAKGIAGVDVAHRTRLNSRFEGVSP